MASYGSYGKRHEEGRWQLLTAEGIRRKEDLKIAFGVKVNALAESHIDHSKVFGEFTLSNATVSIVDGQLVMVMIDPHFKGDAQFTDVAEVVEEFNLAMEEVVASTGKRNREVRDWGGVKALKDYKANQAEPEVPLLEAHLNLERARENN